MKFNVSPRVRDLLVVIAATIITALGIMVIIRSYHSHQSPGPITVKIDKLDCVEAEKLRHENFALLQEISKVTEENKRMATIINKSGLAVEPKK